MHKVTRQRGKAAVFELHRAALSAKYGAPRVSVAGDLKREYFDLGDGRVIMFCSPLANSPSANRPLANSPLEVTNGD